MNFQPETVIRFCKTGIDDLNKVVCHSQQELFDALTGAGKVLGIMQKSSFQRGENWYGIRVDHADIKYYNLMQCDTVLYINDDQPANFYIVGNILSVEWKNEECSFVRFKIDSFMTYQTMIDWDSTWAYVEREHIKEDWSSDGGNPLYSNFGPSESFGTNADVPFYIWKKNFTPDRIVIQSPYDDSGNPVFDGSLKGNLYSSLQSKFATSADANMFFAAIAENKECSIDNIVDVFGIPNEWYQAIYIGGNAYGSGDRQETVPAVNVAAKQLPSMIEYNNAKCWAAPFTMIRLMSSEGDVKDFSPQWLGNDQDEYTVRYRAAGAGGQFGGAQCTFMNKNGAFNWDGWNDFIVSLKRLPSCPWTGDGFTNWQAVNGELASVNKVAAVWGGISGIAKSVAGIARGTSESVTGQMPTAASSGAAIVGGIAGIGDSIMGAGQQLASINTQIQQEKSTGAAVNGGGTYDSLLDVGTDNWGFHIVYYSTQIYAMRSVDAYFDRFGYRVDRLKKLEIENRPIWTFVKTIECHVASTSGIPYIHQRIINNMFNSGATFWKLDQYLAGQKIGDFSKAHDNRGIKGG